MVSKKFEYTNKDIGYLKRDIVMRAFFTLIFLAIIIWQFVMVIMTAINDSLSTLDYVLSSITIITCLLLALISFVYSFKDFRVISTIKMDGRCVSSVPILIKTTRKSFLWLYNLLIQFLTLVTTLVLVASITYSILQYTYFSTISFYMPFLVMICLSGYNSIYHIRDEMNTQKAVQEYTYSI